MRRIIFTGLIGAVVIAIVLAFAGLQYYNRKDREYRQQLENTINDYYLEGRDAIIAPQGRWFRDYLKDSIMVLLVSELLDTTSISLLPNLSLPKHSYLDHYSGWFTLLEHPEYANIPNILKSGKYKWWHESRYDSTPFMIIAKKTDRGYDIIRENILGIGFTTDHFIHQTKDSYGWYSLGAKTNIINQYVSDLYENKYPNIKVCDYPPQDSRDLNNPKFTMFETLINSFRVNKYYELKFDDRYTTMGASPAIYQTGSFGNYFQTIFTCTKTSHYSIQENEGVLKKECAHKLLLLLAGLELINMVITLIRIRHYSAAK